MAVLALNTNGTGLQTSVPYGELVSDSCVKKEAVGTYIDTNSERITNVAATPAHTKRNPYTAPAGPPLCKYRQYLRYRWSRSVLTSGMLARKAYGVFISPRQRYRHILRVKITHTTIPSQVIRIVQLNPSMDINPKLRCFS